MEVVGQVPHEEKCEYLFLLVGGNPLPNAVAGVLLPFGVKQVFLVHSAATWGVASALGAWFRLAGVSGQLVQVDEWSARDIHQKVTGELAKIRPGARVGLNYTGGTKTMAVHAHRFLLDWDRGTEVRFSYLDARSLRLYFDQPRTHAQSVYVGDAVRMTLEDLLKIHRWRQTRPANKVPLYRDVAQELKRACCDHGAWKEWRQWIGNQVSKQCRRQPGRGSEWKSNAELRKVDLELPTSAQLSGVKDTMLRAFAAHGNRLSLRAMSDPQFVCRWLDGLWLEHLVLDAVQEMASRVGFREIWQSVEVDAYGGAVFEVDVVAIRGYQLFVFSCTTEGDRGRQKLKLFEASVRAQQLGGEEARVGLVCCTDDPAGLEQEMRQQLAGPGKVAVFGCPHFQDLPVEIEAWVQSQIGEP